MNNGNNARKTSVKLLQYLQILYQNNAITAEEKNTMAELIADGIKERSFYKLNQKLFEVLTTTTQPNVVEDMIEITF